MEHDLQRFYGIDYRDRFRPDRGLTLRRLCVLCVRHTPLDGEIARAVNGGIRPWTREEGLVDDLRMVVESVNTDKSHKPKPHPDRPSAAKHNADRRVADPAHQRKRAAALRRKRARERAIAAGEIT